MSDSVFYLKINQNTDAAFKCFWHWFKIVELLDADFYVLVDDEEVKNIILNIFLSNGYNAPKFISSYREQLMPIIKPLNFREGKWERVGCALLTPFAHAKENNFKYFWNIDADDTMFLCEPEIVCPVLLEAEQYAKDNNIDVFSLDMHLSCLGDWTFGVAFTIMTNVDFFDCIKQVQFLPRKYFNLDTMFVMIACEGLISCRGFSRDDLWFTHFGEGINSWKNGKIEYLTKSRGRTDQIDRKLKTGLNTAYINENLVSLKSEIKKVDPNAFYANIFHNEKLNYELHTYYVPPLTKKDLLGCTSFENYVYALFRFAETLTIIISTCDNHTSNNHENRKLSLLKSFGIKTDLESTFGYSFIAIIDKGEIVTEASSANTELNVDVTVLGKRCFVSSCGYNVRKTPRCPICISIDEMNYAVSRRGLNFVVIDTKTQKIIDSVAFDTFELNQVSRRILKIPNKVPESVDQMSGCTDFCTYILGLKKFERDIMVFICTRDAHTGPVRNEKTRELQSMKQLGLKTDFEATYRYSYIGVIDGGRVVREMTSSDTTLIYVYQSGDLKIQSESSGYNATHSNLTPVKIEVNGKNYAVDRRGLNFVVWEKKTDGWIDSVVFDTFKDNAAYRL